MATFVDPKSGLHFWYKDVPCFQYMKKYGIYEYDVIQSCIKYLRPQGAFVDIGAHIGTYSFYLSSECKMVYAFEAQQDTYDGLVIGIGANGLTNVVAYNNALGANNVDKIPYHENSLDGGTTSLDADVAQKTKSTRGVVTKYTTMRTLDSFQLTDVDLIKIDVEGLEAQVILGATQTLENSHYPTILFEAWPYDWYQARKNMLLGMLRGIGYQVNQIPGYQHLFIAKDHPKRLAYLNTLEKSANEEYHTVVKLRCEGKRELAYQHILNGLKNAIKGSITWARLHEELGVIAYYMDNIKDKGLRACEEASLSRVPWNIRNIVLFNQGFYMKPLEAKQHITLDIPCPDLYKPSSPSIIRTGDGYLVNVRLVNYTIVEGEYKMRDPDNIIRTRNQLFHLDNKLLLTQEPSVELINASLTPMYQATCMGFEDVRLLSEDRFFSTALMTNDQNTPEVVMGRFSKNGLVKEVTRLQVADKLQCEKNWLPWIVDNNTIRFIYSWQPFRLFELNGTEQKELLNINLTERNLDTFRGSSPPIPYRYQGEDGMLMTVHQVHYNTPRKYFHRLVWISNDLLINCNPHAKFCYSEPFFFHSMNIEFNLSIVASNNKEVIFGYSIEDNSANLAVVDNIVIDRYLDSGTHQHRY
jgi:FkbM family methyltransferase